MKLYIDASHIGVKFDDSETYQYVISLAEVKSYYADGYSFFVNYRAYPRTDYVVQIVYDQLSDYNDLGGVPTYADLVTAFNKAVYGQEEAPSATRTTSAALEASHVISAVPASLYWLNVYNDKGSAQYIQVHDSASLPANGAIPVMTFTLASKATATIQLSDPPMAFTKGIVVANSSTGATLTIGSADCWFTTLSA